MASDIEIKIVAGANLGARLKAAASQARAAFLRELDSATLLIQRTMMHKIDETHRRRSGGLGQVVMEGRVRTVGDVTVRVGPAVEYAEMQERGGRIRAKNVRNLTIPLTPFMTPAGVARGSARDVISSPSSYGYDATFFRSPFIFGKRGDEIEPLFKLQKSVTLPPRPYAEPTATEVLPIIEASISRALEALLKE